MNRTPLLSRALAVLALLGCSSSSQNTQPTVTPPAPGVVDASTAMAEDASVAPPEDVAVAVAPVDAAPAMAPLPPMPTGLHGPTTPWARMNAQQRGQYMAQSVMPVMTEMLHAYDSTRYADVTCATCHGANARAVHFHMPNTLPTLPAFGSPEATAWHQRDPRMFQFMGERMVPAMAQLLGQQPFNMQTHQGFGCGGCHPHA